MSLPLPLGLLFVLLVTAAGGYALATIGMKLASGSVTAFALVLVMLGMAAAAVAEIILLRNAELPVIYLAVIVTETLLVMVYAATIGETLSLSQLSGGLLVITGFSLVCLTG